MWAGKAKSKAFNDSRYNIVAVYFFFFERAILKIIRNIEIIKPSKIYFILSFPFQNYKPEN